MGQQTLTDTHVIFFIIGISLLMALGFLGAFLWSMCSGQQDDLYTPALRMLVDDIDILPRVCTTWWGIATCLVSGISVFQTIRSDKALLALRQLTQPMVSVLRNGKLTTITVEQVVAGDSVWLTEGQTVPADGRLIRFGVLTKQFQTVESVGSATVICTDKTGTITQEGMTLARLYDGTAHKILSLNQPLASSAQDVLSCARWASETEPFDSMERAIVVAYQRVFTVKDAKPEPIIHEYPLGGTPPMMTHVYAPDTGPERVAATKAR